MGKWDTPDPRIQWAIDLYDMEGTEPISLFQHYRSPVVMSIFGGGSMMLANLLKRRPLKANIHFTVLGAAVGAFGGMQFRELKKSRQAETARATLHYVMENPEKFPEPERRKYGDKDVLLHWLPVR